MPSEWRCIPGNTLLIPSGTAGNHLFVVLNEPKDFDGYLDSSILVDICTIRNAPYDDTCVLQPGAHAFIVNQSYVAYKYARLERQIDLIKKVQSLIFTPHMPIDNELLRNIQDGLYISRQTPNFLKKFRFDRNEA